MKALVTILSRKLVRLLLTLLAVSFLIWLFIWYTHTHRPDGRCGRMIDGSIIFCE